MATAKLFKKGIGVADRINLVTRGALAGFSSELDNMLEAGRVIYTQAVNDGYRVALKRYISSVSGVLSNYRRSDRANDWRDLTRKYRREKSPRVNGERKAIGAEAPNNYFQGFRHLHNDKKIKTHRRGTPKGESLISFTKNLVGKPQTIGRLVKVFGGIERVVSGGVFKEGVTLRTTSKSGRTLKTPVLESEGGRRLTIHEALSRQRFYTSSGVTRRAGGGVTYKGKRYGTIKASQLGLIGKKVSFSIVGKLWRAIQAKRSVIDLHSIGSAYGGIFAGNKLQATKLKQMAKKNTKIDPFTDEAEKMIGVRGRKGYLFVEIQRAVSVAASKTNNTRLKTPYGDGRIRIRP